MTIHKHVDAEMLRWKLAQILIYRWNKIGNCHSRGLSQLGSLREI